jgi:localization factor PodJL
MNTGSPPNSPPNSPWCVKGIDRDLRAAAKQAAQREGITLGAWLSRLILEAVGHRTQPVRPAQTAVDAPALETIVGDIRRLTRQIAAAEARANAAVAPLSQQVAQLSSRLDTLHPTGHPTGHPAGAGESRQVEQSMADISARLRELEKSIAAPHRQGVLFGPFDQARR